MTADLLIKRIRALSRPLRPQSTQTASKPFPQADLRAVLFDIYGTLFMSGSGDVGSAANNSADAARQALREAGIAAAVDGDRAVRLVEGAVRAAQKRRAETAPGIQYPEIDIRRVWRSALTEMGLGSTANATVERVAVEYECRVNPVWPMPGTVELLSALRQRGLPLGIVSNSQFYTPLLFPALLRMTAAELGIDDRISAWSYRLLEAKPSLRLFERALDGLRRLYGVTPAETLYVGNDMRNDIRAASQAGCRTALFAGDKRSLRWRETDSSCADTVPDAILVHLRELRHVGE